MAQNWHDIFFTSQDGLRLYARYYLSGSPDRRPLLCLPGLTRNCRDFHALACFLTDPTNPQGRDVLVLDPRGHGRSEWDAHWRNYTLDSDVRDALDLLTIAGMHGVALIGTSRGGLTAMAMARLQPSAVGAVILNDIGPVVEREGLVRAVAPIGRVPLPPSWAEAEAMVREFNQRSFPAVPAEHWGEISRQWFNDDHGKPMPAYDPEIGRAISMMDGPLPELWPQFQALCRLPTMAIRGELSDLLSAATLNEMRVKHPRLTAVTVRGQGHAPLLRDRSTLLAISDFLAQAEPRAEKAPEPRRLIA